MELASAQTLAAEREASSVLRRPPNAFSAARASKTCFLMATCIDPGEQEHADAEDVLFDSDEDDVCYRQRDRRWQASDLTSGATVVLDDFYRGQRDDRWQRSDPTSGATEVLDEHNIVWGSSSVMTHIFSSDADVAKQKAMPNLHGFTCSSTSLPGGSVFLPHLHGLTPPSKPRAPADPGSPPRDFFLELDVDSPEYDPKLPDAVVARPGHA